jgi:ribosome biogenesis GTPase
MDLKILGWEEYQKFLPKEKQNIDKKDVARVAVENRGGYLLNSLDGEIEGIVQGKFMKNAETDADYPKVGDWVEIEKLANESKAIIKSVLPRKTKISRRRVAKDRDALLDKKEEQIIATNVDLVFVIQGLNDDFNIQRLERYVAMVNDGGCEPVIILNKCDLVADWEEKIKEVEDALGNLKIFAVSAKSGAGIDIIRSLIEKQMTVVFVGSSGVGKSTLINTLIGSDLQKTNEIRLDDSKGRHTTTKRELLVLPSGGILIDTPGMRELGLWASRDALGETFDDILMFAQDCKFRDCDHQISQGCAVLAAVNEGKISRERYLDFLKLSQDVSNLGFDNKVSAAQRRILKKQTRKDVNRFVKKKK